MRVEAHEASWMLTPLEGRIRQVGPRHRLASSPRTRPEGMGHEEGGAERCGSPLSTGHSGALTIRYSTIQPEANSTSCPSMLVAASSLPCGRLP
jgi:hypothetical protein